MAPPRTTARLVFELPKRRTGAPLFGVPYKGSPTALAEVVGGRVQTLIDTATGDARARVSRGVMVSSASRLTTVQDLETEC